MILFAERRISFLNIYFLLACALLLCASSGFAQGNFKNEAVIDQIGTDNRALIDQIGRGNRAGSDSMPMQQEGIFNTRDITQQGRNNAVGLEGPGLRQYGLLNDRTLFNTIFILQKSDGNSVGSVFQESRGSNANGVNELSVTQETADRNRVGSVIQIQEAGQAAQSAEIVQSGVRNSITRIEQYSNDSGVEGPNEIDVLISGTNNGGRTLEGFALRPSLSDSAIVQEADGTVDVSVHGNQIGLTIFGDENRFGLRQGGRMNVIGPVFIEGDMNQLGLRQDGTSNRIWMAVVLGDRNEIGVDQLVSNTATVDLIGHSDDNRIYAFQQGDNTLLARIDGDENTLVTVQDYDARAGYRKQAEIAISGSRNLVDLEQLGANMFDLLLDGSGNNMGTLFGDADHELLTAGYFRQKGAGNSMKLTVAGGDNQMGAKQAGLSNSIQARVRGEANQTAFVQLGDANRAVARQNGQNNSAGVFQYE